jgi:hypothetical protein
MSESLNQERIPAINGGEYVKRDLEKRGNGVEGVGRVGLEGRGGKTLKWYRERERLVRIENGRLRDEFKGEGVDVEVVVMRGDRWVTRVRKGGVEKIYEGMDPRGLVSGGVEGERLVLEFGRHVGMEEERVANAMREWQRRAFCEMLGVVPVLVERRRNRREVEGVWEYKFGVEWGEHNVGKRVAYVGVGATFAETFEVVVRRLSNLLASEGLGREHGRRAAEEIYLRVLNLVLGMFRGDELPSVVAVQAAMLDGGESRSCVLFGGVVGGD